MRWDGQDWLPYGDACTPKQAQRLLALTDVRVLSLLGPPHEVVVGTRAAFWRSVLEDVRSGVVVVQQHRGADGVVLVVLSRAS